jgi:hypothetical protein
VSAGTCQQVGSATAVALLPALRFFSILPQKSEVGHEVGEQNKNARNGPTCFEKNHCANG